MIGVSSEKRSDYYQNVLVCMIRDDLDTCWLKVSNIPRRVKLRDLWELLTGYVSVHQILVEDPLPHLGRDCIVQVSDVKAARSLVSASTQNRITLALTPLRMQESDDPSRITKIVGDKQKPSQRRIFLLQVRRTADMTEIGASIEKIAGAFESLKQVRFHPSEQPVDQRGSNFQVLTVLFTNCNQVDLFLSRKLDLTKHPTLSGIRFRKYLGLRYEKDSHHLNSDSTRTDVNVCRSRRPSEGNYWLGSILNRPQSLVFSKQSMSAHNMRFDINDHHHRLKPTSRKYFLNFAKRSVEEGRERHNHNCENFLFNIAPHKIW